MPPPRAPTAQHVQLPRDDSDTWVDSAGLTDRPSPRNWQPETEPLISQPAYEAGGSDSASLNSSIERLLASTLRSSPYKSTAMERLQRSKVRYYADKLAVESEPGLTNAQLMLTNHDLKPGMTIERSQKRWR